ncbi:SDR family NAD(P)-dependent oxidoreductase, partial [Mycobacterium kansasii]
TGRRVLVTGGAQGLGEGMARALTAAGARVMLGDLQADRAATVASELGAGNGSVHLDVTPEESWTAAIDATVAQLGGLDV